MAAPRVIAFAVAVLATLTVAAGCTPFRPSPPPVPVTPPQEPQDADIVAETVLRAPLGEGPGELGAIFPEGAMERVPGAFVVTRDAVLILDTLKARGLEYRSCWLARAVAFPDVIEGASLAVDAQGDWYVFDAVGDVILRATPAGEVRARWPVPEDVAQEGVLLKQGAAGKVVLATGRGEYGLAEPLAGPTAGLSFPGRSPRYTVKTLNTLAAAVCADGEEKWRLPAPQRLSGASLVGFDARGCLIALGVDFSLERSLLVFALHPDGGVIVAISGGQGLRSSP